MKSWTSVKKKMLSDPEVKKEYDKLLREDKSEKVDYTYIAEMKPAFDRIMQRFMMGAKKYARLNFRNCEDYSTYYESALRHLIQAKTQSDEDHLAAACVNILIIMDGERCQEQ